MDEVASQPPSSSPFVGRVQELADLNAGLDRALAGRGQTLLLAGEPGIGKTRIAEELATIAEARGARVIWSQCYEWEGAPAYWPWVQLIREVIRERTTAELSALLAGAAAIAQLIPDLRGYLPAPDNASTSDTVGDPGQARFRLFDSMTSFFTHEADCQPLMLVLEDLHWADPSSLLLLQFVAQAIRSTPLLVLGTYREGEIGGQHPVAATTAELTRQPNSRRINLRELLKTDVEAYLASVTGEKPSSILVDAIYDKTDGNPLFVTEVVRLLAMDGRLDREASLQPVHVRVPESVRDVVARRLGRLTINTQQILPAASVVGREFDLVLLERVATLPAERLLNALDEAVRARVVEETGTAGAMRYRFSHALIQESIYTELPAAQRRLLHQRTGDAIEQLHAADLAPWYSELAEHFLRAAPDETAGRALDYAVAAAEHAMAQLAWESAVEHYQRALHVLDRTIRPEHERIDLLLALSEAWLRAGDAKAAYNARQQAIPLAREHGSLEQRARIATGHGMGSLSFAFTGQEIRELLETVWAELPTEDSFLRVQVASRLAAALHHLPDTRDRRMEFCDGAIAMARRLGDPRAVTFALSGKISAFLEPAEDHWQPPILDELERMSQDTGDITTATAGPFLRAMLALNRGDTRGADRAFTDYVQRAHANGLWPFFSWQATVFRAGRAVLAGEFAEAERLAGETLAIGERVNILEGQSAARHWLILRHIRFLQGRLSELDIPDDAPAGVRPRIATWYRPDEWLMSAWSALVAAESGRLDDARSIFDRLSADGFHDLTYGPSWPARFIPLTHLCAVLGDTDRAATLYEILLPYAGCNVSGAALYYGSGAYYTGLLASLLGRWDDAERHFDAAVTMNSRLRARPYIALTRVAYAEMLTRRGNSADRERTAELVARARATATELGMTSLLTRSDALASDLDQTPAQSGTPLTETDIAARYRLSQRELEVLRLIVAGHSNQQISDGLYLSIRTVERHIANLYFKLGVHSRVEATTFALRHGLA